MHYTTKELSPKTWPDLVRLFQKPGAGDAWWCWCVHFHSRRPTAKATTLRTRADKALRNREAQKKRVEEKRSHGVLVFANDEPVGWCQYGPRKELSHIDNSRNYRKLGIVHRGNKLWRITCFVVDKNHRRQGVAKLALDAVLKSIKSKGGGVVEAYPVVQTDQGPNYLYPGTVSMFEQAGFKIVAPLSMGRTATALMTKTI